MQPLQALVIDCFEGGEGVSLCTPVAGLPLIMRQIITLKRGGCSDVYVVTKDSSVRNCVPSEIKCIDPDALERILRGCKEHFLVLWGDTFPLEGTIRQTGAVSDDFMVLSKPARPACNKWLKFLQGFGTVHIIDEPPDGRLKVINSQNDLQEIETTLLEKLISPTDSWLTKKINRRVSLRLTRKLANTFIHPNEITLLNFLLGIIAGTMFFKGAYSLSLLGAVLFLASSVIDGCDGELARLRYQTSKLGGWLDVVTDNIVHWVLFTGITVGCVKQYGLFPYALFGALLLGGSVGAFLISSTVSASSDNGLLFSESTLGTKTKKPEIIDKLANRDFAYLLLALALLNKIHWFLIAGGVGAPAFAGYLYYLLIHAGEA